MTPEEIALMNEFKDDPEMFQAMLMSMREAKLQSIQIQPEPAEDADPATVCTVNLKGADKKLTRRFLKSNTIQDLINYYKHETQDSRDVSLLIAFPRKELNEVGKTLEEYKFGKGETVQVKNV